MNKSKRLNILTHAETDELYGLPCFNEAERQHYFSLSHEENIFMESLGTTASQVYFILQLGYVKTKSTFLKFSFTEVASDVEAIIAQHIPGKVNPHRMISKNTRQKINQAILLFAGLESNTKVINALLEKNAKCIVKTHGEPIQIFKELLQHLAQHNMMLPSYSKLQDIIGQAIKDENRRLELFLQRHITKHANKALHGLLNNREDYYELTILKKEQKNFNYKHVTAELKKIHHYKRLYQFAKRILPKLQLSQQKIRYYASLASYYTPARLRALPCHITNIYLLCYVYYRIQQINDNLIKSFIYQTDRFHQSAKVHAKECIYQHKIDGKINMTKVKRILNILLDKAISDGTLFSDVKRQIFEFASEEEIRLIVSHLSGDGLDERKYTWEYIDDHKNKISKNLRPIFKAISFTSACSNSSLIKAVNFLQDTFEKQSGLTTIKTPDIPQSCIDCQDEDYLYTVNDEHAVIKHRYEFLIYSKIRNEFDNGNICVEDSINYKSFTDDLIPIKTWNNKKDRILKSLAAPKLTLPLRETLADYRNVLEQRYLDVNHKIETGKNKDIKIRREDNEITWSLPYKKQEEKPNNSFFTELPQYSICDIINFVNEKMDFMSAFTHIKPHYAKSAADMQTIIACIIANGTNYGINKMSDLSNISYGVLNTTQQNFIRLETLRNANMLIVNATQKLAIFNHWNIVDDILHAGVDGQKFEAQLQICKSRYSSKYFGRNKGVVAYSLLANHVPINTKIIGANDHESHFLFDILFNDLSDMEVNRISGDSHSINQVNFALLDFVDCQFAPHIKRINKKANFLYGFNNSRSYNNLIIKPKYKIKQDLIISQWHNVQHIVASLLQQEVKQNVVVSKLSSYPKKNQTLKALCEYDNILMSLYVLDYIDDPMLRLCVRTQLNRIEAYHQLRRAIANVNGNKFRGTTETELEIWNECARLLANIIIYFNSLLLSLYLGQQVEKNDNDIIERLKRISPIAWQHVNMHGRFDFNVRKSNIDLQELVAKLKLDK